MKKQFVMLVVALLVGVTSIFAHEKKIDEGVINDNAVKNYLVGLKSDKDGLRFSCAFLIGEYKIEKAIIPLMKMLHNEKTDEGRIMAALSLVKIGTGKSVFAVKQAAIFDKSERVRNLCSIFYNHYVISNSSGTEL